MRSLRSLTVAVLAVISLGGAAAGLALVTDPSGGSVGLTVDELPGWPLLGDYRVPGLLLFVLFGLLPVVAALHLRRRSARGWTAATAVGVLLVLWSIGQVVVIGLRFPLVQTGFLILGMVLTGLGLDGGATVGTRDEFRPAGRSYGHADDHSRPRPPDRRGEPRGGRRPGRPADRSHAL
ncbi:hypothetical protein [Blastococcus deserti]|uniref:Uncharacterized protein n=1 Tax=Blastococcus deserti TaxID=2259033 RepID=A0ABW4XGX7_9ACTN